MNPLRCFFAICLIMAPALAGAGRLPVFPGAEGFGSDTPAGRGGVVHRVTNLNAAGPGSLQWAIEDNRPRTIVFEVGGTIDISAIGAWGLMIRYPFVTIAGQTAPSPGITIKGGPLIVETHDVLMQHLRVRPGDAEGSGCAKGPANCDALAIVDLREEKDVYNIVIDHCSFSWAIDEVVSTWYPGVRDVTISNCIIGEALNDSLHPKGRHGYGMIIGPYSKNISLIRNLMAHNAQRNPLLSEGSETMLLNNVVYNYQIATSARAIGIKTTIVGNVYIEGPDTRPLSPVLLYSAEKGSQCYLRDNVLVKKGRREHPIAKIKPDVAIISSKPPLWTSPLTILAGNRTEPHVLDHVGARPRDRDATDRRIIDHVKQRRGRIVDSQKDVGGWHETPLAQRSLPLPEHPGKDDDQNGYIQLEEWLHDEAEKVTVNPSHDALTRQ